MPNTTTQPNATTAPKAHYIVTTMVGKGAIRVRFIGTVYGRPDRILSVLGKGARILGLANGAR